MSEWVRAWHRYRRQNRFLIFAFLALLLLSLLAVYLAQRTQVASPRELTNRLLLFVLWYLDISLILVLLFILARNVVRLAVERRSGVLGSRFRTKLVLTYVGLTFVPVIFIFLIATNFLQRSVDRWFSSPVEEVLRGGTSVTEQLREMVEERLARQAEAAATELARPHSDEPLTHLHALLGVDLVALYDGPRLVQAVTDPRRIPRSLPPLSWNDLGLPGHRADRWRGGLLIRAWVPLADGRAVVVGDMLPREVLVHLERASAAYATFQEMKLERGTVTSTTVLVFLAITLLLLFATVWMGLYLSRRFTEPLLAVAAATQRVAEGNQLEEVAIPASDEMAVLVNSFNAMVRRVRATEAEILASNQEMATLLATVPTGVLTIDPAHASFRPNRAAARLLGEPSWSGEWHPLATLDRPGLEPLSARLARPSTRAAHGQLELDLGGAVRHLEVTSEPLPGGGLVVALDDLTQLLRAQRQAAWSEVARRIAHEIKNPLTPIRLAAERIQRHARSVEGELAEVITSGCAAIVAHVAGLKELVDAFHQYAKMPQVTPRPTAVGRLLREVISLYEGLREGVEVLLVVAPDELTAAVDAVLLRQALVNLLDNAVEAIPEHGTVTVHGLAQGQDLVLEVTDTGVGLPVDDPEVLIQPFFSTKGRGSGMGLALVHRVVSDHNGMLELASLPEGGTRVRMVLRGAVAGGSA